MPDTRPILIFILAAALLLTLTARAIQRPTPRDAIQKQPIDYRININTADEPTLCLLPDVGPSIAGRIVDHRETHGPFTKPSQLEDVHLIGPKKREAIEPWVVFE